MRAIEGDASQVAHCSSHVVGDDQLPPFGGLGHAGRQIHRMPDDVVASHQHVAAVDAGPQGQRRDLAELEAGSTAASGSGKVSMRPSPSRLSTRPPRLRTIGPDSRW